MRGARERDDEPEALERAGRLQEIFGKDNLFVELQDHGIPEQKRTNPALMRIASQLGAPLLATNDCHYTHQHDHIAHDALRNVQILNSNFGQCPLDGRLETNKKSKNKKQW